MECPGGSFFDGFEQRSIGSSGEDGSVALTCPGDEEADVWQLTPLAMQMTLRPLSRLAAPTNECIWVSDGVCDDGGHDSEYAACFYGTGCTDCAPPPLAPGGLTDGTTHGGRINCPAGICGLRTRNSGRLLTDVQVQCCGAVVHTSWWYPGHPRGRAPKRCEKRPRAS